MADEEGVHWSFALVDGVTAAAAKMTESVKALEAALKHGDESLKGSHDAAKKETEGAFGSMGESAKGFAEKFFFVTESIKTGAEFLEGVFDKVKEGLDRVLEIGDFRRNAELGLDAMLSTGYQANEVLEKLEDWARHTGVAKDTFTTFGKQLLGEGFKEGELQPLLASLSDVQALNQGKIEASQELLQIFGRIRATDQVNARELAQFGQLGIKPELIYGALAHARNISLQQATQLFKTEGGVHGTEAINDILSAIQGSADKGGPLGKFGQDWAVGSIPAQLTKAKDAIQTFFEGIDTTKFATALGGVTAHLTGPEGEKLKETVGAIFGKLGDWLDHIDFSKVGSGLGKLTDGLMGAAKFAGDLFDGFKMGWADMEPSLDAMGGVLGSIFGSDGSSNVKLFAQSIMDVVGAFVLVGETAVAIVGFIGVGIVAVVEGLAWVVGAMVDYGVNLVQGLWSGIKSAWGWMLGEFHALLELLPASVKHVLGIASPSKVFAGLGLQTMQGFTVGLEQVPVQDTIADIVTPRGGAPEFGALRPNARSLSDFGAGGGGGGPMAIHFRAEIHLDGSKEPHATADELVSEMRRIFLPELATAFEQLRIEVGG